MSSLLVKGSFLVLIIALVSCHNKSDDQPSTGQLQIQFVHRVGGQALVKNQMIYTNAAGNSYEVDGLKYFISDVRLHRKDGASVLVDTAHRAHYVDVDIQNTQSWLVADQIPAASYDSVSFTFGMNEQLNKSNRFVNPPESNMAWPEVLGGGYHFMMMDGFFNNTLGVRSPFSFHLGTGQIYTGGTQTSNITGFVQNYFHVKLPTSAFTLMANQKNTVTFVMNIDSWFATPIVWDFNRWSTMLMQNQAAMQAMKTNGGDVFSFETELGH